MIAAGTLTEKLEFYHIVETQSESGYKSTEEVHYMTLQAYRLKNKENYIANGEQIYHNVDLTFKTYFRNGMSLTDIVVYENEKYRITSLDKYPRDREMTIKIQKIVD